MLQRWILVHSIIYYELNDSVVPDTMFDNNANQLAEMQERYPDDAANTNLWYIFSSFDGSTGFDLYRSLSKVDQKRFMEIAKQVLSLQRRDVK